MSTGEINDQFWPAFIKAQAEMPPVKFDKVNPHFKNEYASLGALLAACVPALNKNDIALTQPIQRTDNGDLLVTTRITHKSGTFQDSSYLVPRDKPQQMGSGITYGRRYTLQALLGIAGEEDDDGNLANETAPAKLKANGKPKGPNTDDLRDLVRAGTSRGVTPEEMTEYVQTHFKVDSVREITPEQLKELNTWIRLDPTKTKESEEEAHA